MKGVFYQRGDQEGLCKIIHREDKCYNVVKNDQRGEVIA